MTNAKSVGGFKNLPGQDVRLDDGLFEVTLIKGPKTPLELNEIIASLLVQEDHTDLIDSFKTDRIIIETFLLLILTYDTSMKFFSCYKYCLLQTSL